MTDDDDDNDCDLTIEKQPMIMPVTSCHLFVDDRVLHDEGSEDNELNNNQQQ
jgi:hypothetical protein